MPTKKIAQTKRTSRQNKIKKILKIRLDPKPLNIMASIGQRERLKYQERKRKEEQKKKY